MMSLIRVGGDTTPSCLFSQIYDYPIPPRAIYSFSFKLNDGHLMIDIHLKYQRTTAKIATATTVGLSQKNKTTASQSSKKQTKNKRTCHQNLTQLNLNKRQTKQGNPSDFSPAPCKPSLLRTTEMFFFFFSKSGKGSLYIQSFQADWYWLKFW